MKKVVIIGLDWLGIPLAMSLMARGQRTTGSKTTLDGVEVARMNGIESCLLRLEPELACEVGDLDASASASALVITLPARRSGPGGAFRPQVIQKLADSALAYRILRIIFTSSTLVYGNAQGTVKGGAARSPIMASGHVLKELEDWLYNLPGTPADILCLIRSVDPGKHSGRSFASKTTPGGHHGINLVHLDDVVSAITLLLQAPRGEHIYNICASMHPAHNMFYPQMARQLGMGPPEFRGGTDNGEGKVIDGNRICNELGFECQYPDPLVMPME